MAEKSVETMILKQFVWKILLTCCLLICCTLSTQSRNFVENPLTFAGHTRLLEKNNIASRKKENYKI